MKNRSISRTLDEYLLLPGKVKKCDISTIDLTTRFAWKENDRNIKIKIPIVAAAMQSVSSIPMSVAIALEGGLAFVNSSRPISEQARVINITKKWRKNLFCYSYYVEGNAKLKELRYLINDESIDLVCAVTDDGTSMGHYIGYILLNLDVTFSDSAIASDIMINLNESGYAFLNSMDIEEEISQYTPVLDDNYCVAYYYSNSKKNYPDKLLDDNGELFIGAAINTWDYMERVPKIVESGANAIFIDSMNGYSDYVKEVLVYIRKKYGTSVIVGCGNVVTASGFEFLVECGASFVMIGMTSGHINPLCEEYGVGLGLATAVEEIVKVRDSIWLNQKKYIPICCNGYINNDYQIAIALALGADYIMMGKYFAGLIESPGHIVIDNGKIFKEHWGECSNHSTVVVNDVYAIIDKNINSLIPFKGYLSDNISMLKMRLKKIIHLCGFSSLESFKSNNKIVTISKGD